MRRFATLVMSGLLSFLFLVFGGTMAQAVPPLTGLDGLITDQSGQLGDSTAQTAQAQADFHAATGGQFYVVVVDSFDGTEARVWASTTGRNAELGSRDVLLAVAPGDPDYWLEYGGDLVFLDERAATLVPLMDQTLTAGLNGTITWDAAVANVIGAVQNEIVTHEVSGQDETTVVGTEPAPEGVQNDGGVAPEPTPGATADGNHGATAPAETSGGLPMAARIALIALGLIAAAIAIIYGYGGYKRKRLEARQAENPFNV